jgi:threonine aldolase
MFFASDNGSGAAPEIMAELARANEGFTRSYGADALTAEATALVRATFEAPEAEVFLVTSGTAANALSIALMTPPWGAVFLHETAHAAVDECGAPEFFAAGAKLICVPGPSGKITPHGLAAALNRVPEREVHAVQRAMLTLTNLTEAGTVYTPAEIAALTALARDAGLPSHLDGSRLANALVASGASPAEMTWKAGVDVLSLGGTKNGCLGVEAVVLFDPSRAWEFQLRRKRAGHLMSKHRFLAAQMGAYLRDGLWLRLAAQANAMGARLAQGLAQVPGAQLQHPAPANMMFPAFAPGTNARAAARGAVYYPAPAPAGMEGARLVASWSTTPADVDALLAALMP